MKTGLIGTVGALAAVATLMETETGNVMRDTVSGRWVLASPGGERFEWVKDATGRTVDRDTFVKPYNRE